MRHRQHIKYKHFLTACKNQKFALFILTDFVYNKFDYAYYGSTNRLCIEGEGTMAEEEKKEMTKNPEPEEKLSWQKNVLLYLHDLTSLLAVIMLCFILLFRFVVVSQVSMFSTLWDGDWLLVLSSVFYHNPQCGDIIIASKDSFDDGKPIVKRVIATEGQTVDIDFESGTVYVDGVALEEDYLNTSTTNSEGVQFPLVVDDGCLFVMGDNRQHSKDSRDPEIGLIDKREVLGKAIFLLFPGTHDGELNRDFGRIGALK